jgi:hypothetical protein
MSDCACGCSGGSCACQCASPQLEPPDNRAGLSAVRARLGDYFDFFGAAVRRLSDGALPALRRLGTREPSDPAIAWLDAWAVTADVLTFYRERLTNESYLRTTQDERALRELAALVGYQPRPGVAATAFLAYQMDASAKPVEIPASAKAQTVPGPGEQMQTFETDDRFVAHADWSKMAPRLTRPAAIPFADALSRSTLRLAGTTTIVQPGQRVLFVYGPEPANQVVREIASSRIDVVGGFIELQLKPRFSIEDVAISRTLADELAVVRTKLVSKTPQPRELNILSFFLLGGTFVNFFLSLVPPDLPRGVPPPSVDEDVLKLLKHIGEAIQKSIDAVKGKTTPSSVDDILSTLETRPAGQPSSGRHLTLSAGATLSAHGPDRLAALTSTTRDLGETLAAALDTLPVTDSPPEQTPDVLLFRATANSFAAFAPPLFVKAGDPPGEHAMEAADRTFHFLDTEYPAIRPGSYVIVDLPAVPDSPDHPVEKSSVNAIRALLIARVVGVQTVARHAYGLSMKTTRLEVPPIGTTSQPFPPLGDPPPTPTIAALRSRLYHVQSEPVVLFGDSVETDVGGPAPNDRIIELQTRIDGLQVGQWVIVAGERTDIRDTNGASVPGVAGGELAMIGDVDQKADPSAPADTLHTVITLVTPLAYTYKRATTTVYGNVVRASHGETVSEVLGSGDASRNAQRFAVKRGPMTFTTAATPTGADSSEVVRVNGLRYERVDSLLDAGPASRAYALDLDATGLATLVFGDGTNGARLPSGAQNVRVRYRVGLGTPGNVRAEQISMLTDRPLGVSGVINPLRADGGADRDTAERIRQNTPLVPRGLSQLARLVSVEDYANFARRFAGIGHADAVHISDGAQQLVYVTVAGVNDAPIDPDGELLSNLHAAYVQYGDPTYPVEIGVRDLTVLVLQAKVAIDPDADWDAVEPTLRARLNDAFSFERRRLGQSCYLSEAIRVMQLTPGVAWVDVDKFGGITEAEIRSAKALDEARNRLALSAIVPATGAQRNPKWRSGPADAALPRFVPSQLVCMLPTVAGLVVLNLTQQEA